MKLSKQELEAVIAASPRSFVPFNKLVLSPTYQARPENPAAPLPLAELAACIDGRGQFGKRQRRRRVFGPRPSMPLACCTT
jgi:hypothetical protein